ncbi:MAG TPA: hypothetical protein VF818_12335 [Ktedonobacterales bacterium]
MQDAGINPTAVNERQKHVGVSIPPDTCSHVLPDTHEAALL